jgi:hypothetical protein
VLGVAVAVTTTTLGVDELPEPDPDAETEAGVDETEAPAGAVVMPDSVACGGGGMEEAPPTRAPVPQGMFVPSGWVDSVGGTMSAGVSVIVNRPVHVLSVLPEAVN